MACKCPLCGQFMSAFEIHYHKKEDGFVYRVEPTWNWWAENKRQNCDQFGLPSGNVGQR